MQLKINKDNAGDTANTTTKAGAGVLFTIVAYILLASVGACGDSCQGCALTGIAQTRNAIVDGTAENAFAEEK